MNKLLQFESFQDFIVRFYTAHNDYYVGCDTLIDAIDVRDLFCDVGIEAEVGYIEQKFIPYEDQKSI